MSRGESIWAVYVEASGVRRDDHEESVCAVTSDVAIGVVEETRVEPNTRQWAI